ncbi:hypothetical protein Poly30_04980 [Planctomycetes bacterium Poly30]|uniref:Uncharacterized protein n=1 Tax=Saltatorellus ferox TaxID=2528018 RepID=A0A518ELP0_9BACT|nr:hypothetical protein Poly30_04980 [Planctomycetes bacterium Poly30]
MSDPYESPFNDLFHFPEVEGLEEFGLVPPVPASMRVAEAQPTTATGTAANSAAATPGAAGTDGDQTPTAQTAAAQTPATQATSAQAPGSSAASGRPNPPLPDGIDDLDEDLFGFDELFSLDDDPYRNGTLSAEGLPANDLFLDPTPAPAPAAPAAPQAAAPAPQTAPVQPAPQSQAQQPPAAPLPQAPQAQPAPQPQFQAGPAETVAAPAADLPASFPPLMSNAGSAPAGSNHALRDRGPRILLPEDIPYSQSSEKQRLLWVLVACFLLVNTGIFFVAYQASAAFQSSLQVTTDKLADAIAQDKSAPAVAAPSEFPATSASVGVDPSLTYTMNTPTSLPAGSDLPERSQRDRWIDPRDYANTHEFAVGNAKALLADGRFEEARRLLNHVLANQARIPLSPVLREEIDYLIPLTYFEHGKATAPQREERP